MMRRWERPETLIVLLTLLVVSVDQATKALADTGHRNAEMMLGLASASRRLTIGLSFGAVIAFGLVTVVLAQRGRISSMVPGFLIGGGISNVLDRLRHPDGVYDFIETSDIVWNIADLAIAVGLAAYFVGLWRTRSRPVVAVPPEHRRWRRLEELKSEAMASRSLRRRLRSSQCPRRGSAVAAAPALVDPKIRKGVNT